MSFTDGLARAYHSRLGFSLAATGRFGPSAALPTRFPSLALDHLQCFRHRSGVPPPRIGPSTLIRKTLRSRTTGTAQMEGLGAAAATSATPPKTPAQAWHQAFAPSNTRIREQKGRGSSAGRTKLCHGALEAVAVGALPRAERLGGAGGQDAPAPGVGGVGLLLHTLRTPDAHHPVVAIQAAAALAVQHGNIAWLLLARKSAMASNLRDNGMPIPPMVANPFAPAPAPSHTLAAPSCRLPANGKPRPGLRIRASLHTWLPVAHVARHLAAPNALRPPRSLGSSLLRGPLALPRISHHQIPPQHQPTLPQIAARAPPSQCTSRSVHVPVAWSVRCASTPNGDQQMATSMALGQRCAAALGRRAC
ncbi:hypothetical protein IQ07DRAFT_602237 [Pyrenochaeta sp. DS3sAY3a]|nr:hypothetical protein IQ07DRAFT_602237 [Pyrenochaeta sp. DS3sAY3a]